MLPCLSAATARVDERLINGGLAILRNAFVAVSGDGRYATSLQIDGADAAVVEVGQEQLVARRIERCAINTAEFGFDGGAAVAAEAFARAGDSADHARFGIDGADAVVPGVGEIDRVVGTDRQIVHPVELRIARGATVAADSLLAVAGDVVSTPLLSIFRTRWPVISTRKRVAGAIEFNTKRRVELRFDCGRAVFAAAAAGDEDKLFSGRSQLVHKSHDNRIVATKRRVDAKR